MKARKEVCKLYLLWKLSKISKGQLSILSEGDFRTLALEHKSRVWRCKEQILINEEKEERDYLDTLFIVQDKKVVEEDKKKNN